MDHKSDFAGFISEFDLLRALEANKELGNTTAEQIMAKDRIAVTEETTIEDAVKLMEEKRLLKLPVKRNGKIAYTITRHDLLRAKIRPGTRPVAQSRLSAAAEGVMLFAQHRAWWLADDIGPSVS